MTSMTRIRITLASLIALTVIGVGVFTRAVGQPSGPATGLTVAVAGTVTVIGAALALRMLVVLQRVTKPVPAPVRVD
jgi:uncharacterized membrane protein (UPF0136 family)